MTKLKAIHPLQYHSLKMLLLYLSSCSTEIRKRLWIFWQSSSHVPEYLAGISIGLQLPALSTNTNTATKHRSFLNSFMKPYTLLIPLLLIACRKNSPSPAIITPPNTAATVVLVPLNIPFVPYYDSFYGKLSFNGYDTLVTFCIWHTSAGTIQFTHFEKSGSISKVYTDEFTGDISVNDSNEYCGHNPFNSNYTCYKVTVDSLFYDASLYDWRDLELWHYAGKRTSKLPSRDQ